MTNSNVTDLINLLEPMYQERSKELLFHGWHHVCFVHEKAREFALAIEADLLLVEAAALTHDLNYLVKPNSEPEEGAELRSSILQKAGFTLVEIEKIEKIVLESHTRTRGQNISNEGKALSDADTLFKALPITPLVLSSKYIEQNKVDLSKLANKVVTEQTPLMDQNIYFYTELAKSKYMKWARTNLDLWTNVAQCLNDKSVTDLLNRIRD